MVKNSDVLFKHITEKIAETDFTGYTIQYPPLFAWNDAILGKEILKVWKRIIKTKPERLGLYIHLPYCKQKCSYCRYFSIELSREEEVETYLSALKKEIEIYKRVFSCIPIHSLYLGGGTPSLLNVKQLDRLFSCLYKNFNLLQCQQIVFEGNPDFLDLQKIKLLKRWGCNRLTIGVQSLDRKVIKAVNRYQSEGSLFKCFQSARKAKIKNINIDLMVGLPLQTIKSALDTIKAVVKLRPEMIHIHPFYPTALSEFIRKSKRLSRADMRRREKMALISWDFIQAAGYKAIKFDADALNDEARNIQLSDAIEYNAPFLGLGAGAVSHATGYLRYANTIDLNEYRTALNNGKLPVFSCFRLTKKDEMVYFLTACLRYGVVDKFQFKELFKEELDAVFSKEIEYLTNRKKIKDTPWKIISLVKNIGEYLLFSKYFYSQSVINKCKNKLNWRQGKRKKVTKEQLRYMLL